MRMTWNSDANEKLLFGIIAQMKQMNIKLNYNQLAAHMGSECTAVAVQLHLKRLRRQVEGSGSTENTPNASPAKRKATGEPKTSTKRGKGKKASPKEGIELTVKEDDEEDSKMKVKKEAGYDFDSAV